MISFDPKFFKAAVRSTLDKIWRRCFEERIVEVCYRGLNLQMHTKKNKMKEVELRSRRGKFI